MGGGGQLLDDGMKTRIIYIQMHVSSLVDGNIDVSVYSLTRQLKNYPFFAFTIYKQTQ
jgi:hypothetical protein